MKKCKDQGVTWAIFSDLYGVYFPSDRHSWYEMPPDKVNEEEFKRLVWDFDKKLKGYHEIWFYHHPARFHRLYRRLLKESRLKGRVKLFTKVLEIV